ncbi:hypothetical protein BKA69DRAFT_1033110 [Paraphysoderma sedebokerense]|nr:hypothetical protein BKA69DRAFT_1033110 [Paraphysoderma sedebokerense]
MKSFTFGLALVILSFITTQVAGHGAIVGVKGMNGISGRALGIVESTPRNCQKKVPCQQDTAIIRNFEIAAGRAGACGRTLAGGNIDMNAEVSKMMSELGGLPEVMAGKAVTLTVHQVNADGAGPFSCEVDATGTGQSFKSVQVTRNVPGILSLNVLGSTQPHPLEVQMPADLNCSGGPDNNMCMIRCRNAAVAGPFGGCVPVAQAKGAAKK